MVKRYHGDPSAHWDGSWQYVDGKDWKEEKHKQRRERIYVQVKTLLESGAVLHHSILGNIMDREMTLLLLEYGGLSLNPKEYLRASKRLDNRENKGWELRIENGVVRFRDSDNGTLFEAMLIAQKQETILEYLEKIAR